MIINEIKKMKIKDKPRKNPWVMYCSVCGVKVSSETHEFYYRNQVEVKETGGKIAVNTCSFECAEKESKNVINMGYMMKDNPGKFK